ncbi:MAG: hypothetical protein KAI81_08090, partial [Candidatus Marinimicrobia bacterium]|nr:hypothetical protein [Candidatus Neomarinimicrobiota bacterium]
HIPHISVPTTVKLVAKNRENMPFSISCGATPHHLFLNTEMMQNPTDMELKVNPPIRSKKSANELLELLKNGQIDWIETDHAPHTLENKRFKQASGIPGLPLWPHIPTLLKNEGLSNSIIENLTHNNIEKCFNFAIPRINSTKNTNLFNEYPINAYGHLVKSL